jgi:hypothetical protein
MQVWDKFQEGIQQKWQCWTMQINKPTELASEILHRWYLQCQWNRFIFSCHAGRLPKLQTWTLSSSTKAMDHLSVLHCSNTSETDKLKLLVTGEGPNLGALRGLVWTFYHFCTMLTKMCGWHVKFLRNGYELECGITIEIKENVTGSWQRYSIPSFRFSEQYPTWISVSHITSLVQPINMGINKFEDLI